MICLIRWFLALIGKMMQAGKIATHKSWKISDNQRIEKRAKFLNETKNTHWSMCWQNAQVVWAGWVADCDPKHKSNFEQIIHTLVIQKERVVFHPAFRIHWTLVGYFADFWCGPWLFQLRRFFWLGSDWRSRCPCPKQIRARIFNIFCFVW